MSNEQPIQEMSCSNLKSLQQWNLDMELFVTISYLFSVSYLRYYSLILALQRIIYTIVKFIVITLY